MVPITCKLTLIKQCSTMNSEKVVIKREIKKSPSKDTLPGDCTINWITQVYKEIHIFRPSSRQGAQVVGFQGERQLSLPLLLYHSLPTTLQGAVKSWPHQISARAWRLEARRQDQQGGSGAKGKVKKGWDLWRLRQILRREGSPNQNLTSKLSWWPSLFLFFHFPSQLLLA